MPRISFGTASYICGVAGPAISIHILQRLPKRRAEASSVLRTADRICYSLGQWGRRAMDQLEMEGWLAYGVVS